MPIENKMHFIRPDNCDNCGGPECDSCIQGYYALQHVIDYANQVGGYTITENSGSNSYQTNVFTSLQSEDPAMVYGFGHGNNCVYTTQETMPVFECGGIGTPYLAGRIVYLLSCLTANGLGEEIVQQGAVAYAGFNISWTWLAESTGGDFTYLDPYDDPYAFCFYESANELWLSLIDGYSFQEAVLNSIAKYNEWINYWYYDAPEDPYSQDCIQWLIHDRDGLVALTQCELITDQTECTTNGCYWYNESCHAVPEQNGGGGLNLLFILPILLVVGVAFIATSGTIKTSEKEGKK